MHITPLDAPRRVYFIEGNIGCGKSTLLHSFSDDTNFYIVQEPVDEWLHLLGFVQARHLDPAVFQFVVLMSICTALLEALQHSPPTSTLIVERSIESNYHVFAKSTFPDASTAAAAYDLARSYANRILPSSIDAHYIYLRASPATCLARAASRGRAEESQLPLSYLELLHDLHDTWLLHHPSSSVVDASQAQQVVHAATRAIVANTTSTSTV
jgi:deoxyadenosine/deoxycytidine kinase